MLKPFVKIRSGSWIQQLGRSRFCKGAMLCPNVRSLTSIHPHWKQSIYISIFMEFIGNVMGDRSCTIKAITVETVVVEVINELIAH